MDRKSDPQAGHHAQATAGAYPRSPEEVEQLVVMERHHLYNAGLPCGAVALRRHLHEHDGEQPVPSVRQIGQILTRYGLTHGRTGWYEGEEPGRLPTSARGPKAQRRSHAPSIATRDIARYQE